MTELMEGAEPFSGVGGPVGVLVVHGFTGNPQSMRPLGIVQPRGIQRRCENTRR